MLDLLHAVWNTPSMQTNTQNNADRVSARENAKRTKTWNIGEYCTGGIIRAKSNGEVVKLEIIDSTTNEMINWFVFDKLKEYAALDFLCSHTTPYYSDNVMKWIKSNVWGNK